MRALAAVSLLIILLAVVAGSASHLTVDGGYLQVFQYTAEISVSPPAITPTPNWSGIRLAFRNVESACDGLSAELFDQDGRNLPGPVQWYLCHGKNNPSTTCNASVNYGSGFTYPEPDGRMIIVFQRPPQNGNQYFFRAVQPPGSGGGPNIFSMNIDWPPAGCPAGAQRIVIDDPERPGGLTCTPTLEATPQPTPAASIPATSPSAPLPTKTGTGTPSASPEPGAGPTATPETPTATLTDSPTQTPTPAASPDFTVTPADPGEQPSPAPTNPPAGTPTPGSAPGD